MLQLREKKAFTLVEIIIATFIFSLTIAGMLYFFSNAIFSGEFTRDMTVAVSHAEYILEEMQSRDSLFEITQTDWPQWAKSEGLDTLNDEICSVSFLDESANPLDIKVTINWKQKLKPNHITLVTKITR